MTAKAEYILRKVGEAKQSVDERSVEPMLLFAALEGLQPSDFPSGAARDALTLAKAKVEAGSSSPCKRHTVLSSLVLSDSSSLCDELRPLLRVLYAETERIFKSGELS